MDIILYLHLLCLVLYWIISLRVDACSAFDMEREREWRQRENALKVQIAQLEATLKADLGEKGESLNTVRGLSK